MKCLFKKKSNKGTSFYLFGKKIFHFGIKTSKLIENLLKEFDGLRGIVYASLDPKDLKPARGILRDIQLSSLKILKEIDKVCKEHKLTYWIDYGTLIGAVRHKGFIPWDDDIDICMIRDDYERFVEIFNKNNTDTNLKAIFFKDHIGEILIKVVHTDIPNLVFVDIFPVDYCYKQMDDEEKIIFSERLKKLSSTHIKLFKNYTSQDDYRESFIKLRNENIKEIIPNDNAKPSLFYGLEFYHKEPTFNCFDWDTIFPLKSINFEGIDFPCVNDEDIYLTMVFGDYMQLPNRLHFHNNVANIDVQKMLIIKRYLKN
ncbi:MAG: LicD family protein [Alphaproteobacteria bacterium]|nr:LicD family protein [Alphaproteobacteria bacterium]